MIAAAVVSSATLKLIFSPTIFPGSSAYTFRRRPQGYNEVPINTTVVLIVALMPDDWASVNVGVNRGAYSTYKGNKKQNKKNKTFNPLTIDPLLSSDM
jgi:hypothetical protein